MLTPILGSVQRFPEAIAPVHMVVSTHVFVGYHDGMVLSYAPHPFLTSNGKTVQGLVHNYGGLLGKGILVAFDHAAF